MEFLWTYLLPFLAILTALVFVHELGHYSVARWAGVRVEVFSIGFGPELFGWTAASGTRWKFSAIPLGGYVKMFGDSDPASAGQADDSGWTDDQRKVAFHHQSLRDRALIIAAGPAANFAFAIVLLAGLFMTAGQPQAPAVVDQVVAGSAAERAGLRAGDRILAIDGASIAQFEDLRRIVVDSPGRALAARVARDGREIELTVVPESAEVTDNFGNTHRIGRLGVRSEQTEVVRLGPVAAVGQAVVSSYVLVERTLSALGEIITGARTADELGALCASLKCRGPWRKPAWSRRFGLWRCYRSIWG